MNKQTITTRVFLCIPLTALTAAGALAVPATKMPARNYGPPADVK